MKPKPEPTKPRPTKASVAPSPTADSNLSDLAAPISSLDDLDRHVVDTYTPVVTQIINNRSNDKQKIEKVLGRLVIAARIPEGLGLFKSLCSYYFRIDPDVTESYVHFYRDLWDNKTARIPNQNPAKHLSGQSGALPSTTVDPDLREIVELFNSLREAQRQAANRVTPIVSDLISTNSRNTREIEQTLDHLLGGAGSPEGLLLFTALSRYYLFVDAAAAQDYIQLYRKMWGDDGKEA